MHPIEILRVPYVLQLFFSDFWSTFSARNSNVFDQENFVFTFENKTIYILIIVKTEFSWTISGWKHAPKNPKKMLKSIRPIFLGLLVFLVAWTPPKNTSNTKKWNQVMSNQLENIIVQCTNFLRIFPCKIQANINIFSGTFIWWTWVWWMQLLVIKLNGPATTLGHIFLKVFAFSQCTGQVLLENALSRVNFNIFGNLNYPNWVHNSLTV